MSTVPAGTVSVRQSPWSQVTVSCDTTWLLGTEILLEEQSVLVPTKSSFRQLISLFTVLDIRDMLCVSF